MKSGNDRHNLSFLVLTVLIAACGGSKGQGGETVCNKVASPAKGQLLLGGWHDNFNFQVANDRVTFVPKAPADFARNLKRMSSYSGRGLAWTYVPVSWTTDRFTFPSDHVAEIRKALGPVVPLVLVDLNTANLGCSAKDCFYRDIAETTVHDAKIRDFADAVASFSGSDRKPLMLAFNGEANVGWEGMPPAELYKAAVRKIYRVLRDHNQSHKLVSWVYWGNTRLSAQPGSRYADFYPEDIPNGIVFDWLMTGLHSGYPGMWPECVSGVTWLRQSYPYTPDWNADAGSAKGLYAQVLEANPNRPILLEIDATATISGPTPREDGSYCVVDNPNHNPNDPDSHQGVKQWIAELYAALARGDFPNIRGVSWWGDAPFQGSNADAATWFGNLINPLDNTDPENASPPVRFDFSNVMAPAVDQFRASIADSSKFLDSSAVKTTTACEIGIFP